MKKISILLFIIGIGIIGFGYTFSDRLVKKTSFKVTTTLSTTTTKADLKNTTGTRIDTAPFQTRDSHGLVVFNNAMGLMGGLDGNKVTKGKLVEYGKAPHFSDVGKSTNGIDGELITSKAPGGKRRSLPLVVFKDKLGLIGGYQFGVGTKGDIGSTSNGKDGKLVSELGSFGAREGHTITVFNDKLGLIGGVNFDKRKTYDDIGYSEDGLIGKPANIKAPFSVRYDHTVVVFQNKMGLLGGLDFGENIQHDVWNSPDGITWNLVTDTPPFDERHGHTAEVYKDKLFFVSGGSDKTKTNDMGFTSDGITWEQNVISEDFVGREDHGVVVLKDKIGIIGGMDTNYHGNNDIGYSN